MNVRLTILLVLVLGLIGGTVWATQALRPKEPKDEPPWLFRMDFDQITHISVTHLDKSMEYAKVRTGDTTHWVIKDGNDTPVFVDKWSGTTLLLSGPRTSPAVKDVVITDPADYGLDSPQTKVRIVDKAGVPLTFHLGDVTPDGDNWYAQLIGTDQLFTVVSIWGEVISRLASEPPYAPTPFPTPIPTPTPTGEAPPSMFRVDFDQITHISVTHLDKSMEYAKVPTGDTHQWAIKDGNDTPVFEQKWAGTTLLLSGPGSARQ